MGLVGAMIGVLSENDDFDFVKGREIVSGKDILHFRIDVIVLFFRK